MSMTIPQKSVPSTPSPKNLERKGTETLNENKKKENSTKEKRERYIRLAVSRVSRLNFSKEAVYHRRSSGAYYQLD
jgi:hypothetical protein